MLVVRHGMDVTTGFISFPVCGILEAVSGTAVEKSAECVTRSREPPVSQIEHSPVTTRPLEMKGISNM